MLSDKVKRRNQLTIMADILETAKQGTLKTQIMYKANLSFTQLHDYLTFMLNSELLEQNKTSGKEVYMATTKGSDFLVKHSELIQILRNGSFRKE